MPNGLDLAAVLGQYGVIGVVATLLYVYAKGQNKRETDRSDRLEAENTRLHTKIETMHVEHTAETGRLHDRIEHIQADCTAALVSTGRALEDSTHFARELTSLVRELQVDRELRRRGSQ